MKNPIQPTVSLTVPDPMKGGDVTFRLRFNFETIAEVEEVTGRPLLTGFNRRTVAQPTIAHIRAMLYAALLPDEPKITFAEASAFVTKKSHAAIWDALLVAWVAFKEEPEETEAGPSRSQG